MFPRAQVNPSNSSFLHKRPKSSQTKFLITDVCRITPASVNVHVTQAPLRYWPLFGCLFAGLLSLSATHGTSRAVNNSPPNTHTFFSKLYFQFSQVSQDHCENYQSQRQMFPPPPPFKLFCSPCSFSWCLSAVMKCDAHTFSTHLLWQLKPIIITLWLQHTDCACMSLTTGHWLATSWEREDVCVRTSLRTEGSI